MNIQVKEIDAILPQTQCGKCNHKNCHNYAEAIFNGEPHNQCPPGGKDIIKKLSFLLKKPVLKLNPNNGIEQPKAAAIINESLCIGCKKCILACPVDAIVGAGKLMHTIIRDECTGCELCIEPCPMDCIQMLELANYRQPIYLCENKRQELANHYRKQFLARNKRLDKQANQIQSRHEKNKLATECHNDSIANKQDLIAKALKEFRQKKEQLKASKKP